MTFSLRLFAPLLLGAAALLVGPRLAFASDGGGDDAMACVTVDDACKNGDTCCNGATCGAFGSDGALVCGFATGACLAVGAACDAGAQCGCSQTCTSGHCALPVDGGVVQQGCIANGEPCSSSQKCCTEGAYCGSFGGTGNSRVCGVDSTNQIGTSSCAVGGTSGADALWIVGAVGVAVGARVRRKRRQPSPLARS